MAETKAEVRCRHFGGYKPCDKSSVCNQACPHLDVIQNSILIVHLGAIGAVVRATSLLSAIEKKYPHSLITWVTDAPSDQLLRNHPRIDRVLTTSTSDLLLLQAYQFDLAFVVDKSPKAVAIANLAKVNVQFGFTTDSKSGGIVPANKAAHELWQLGLSNQKKFFENKKPETQLLMEALELGPFAHQEYDLPLTFEEIQIAQKRRQEWSQSQQPLIGINTGCSPVIPYKKLTVEYQRRLIQELLNQGYTDIVLLGGPEDTHRNQQIAKGLPIRQSETTRGLRDGLVSVAACDLVLTGDSLGMHMAISQKKYVIAWFGPTCSHEIDLYGRGMALQTDATCAPCWKRLCDQASMCYDQVSLQAWVEAVHKGQQWWIAQVKHKQKYQIDASSSSKPPFSEICS